jgi:4-amino-4-deoxy-L-arabinose transferase-like glycosyltransferase
MLAWTRKPSIREPGQSADLRHVALILLVGAGARLFLFGAFQPWDPRVETEQVLQSDAQGYHRLATTLLESHRFSDSSEKKPDGLRTPLYPMFIAACYLLFGYKPWVVILTQIAIDSMSCFLLLRSLGRLFSRKVALIASMLYALDPFLILFSSTALLSDTLFVFFLVAALWCLSHGRCREVTRETLLYCGSAGLFLGLAALTRPVAQFILVGYLVFLSVAYWKRPGAVLRYALLGSLVFCLTLSPWLFRNYRTFGYFSLSISGPYNLLILNVLPMEMSARHADARTVRASLLAEADGMMQAEGRSPQELNAFQRAQYWQRLAVGYIGRKPTAFARSFLLGVFHMFFNLDTKTYAQVLGLPTVDFDIKGYDSIVDLASAFIEKKGVLGLLLGGAIAPYLLVAYAGALVGLVVSWKRYDGPSLLLVLMFALYFVLITGAAGLARFKMPSIPFYLAFSGIGLSYLWEGLIPAIKARKHRADAGPQRG